MASSLWKECSICENELKASDSLVTTECSHKFHRSCAQDRLDKKNKSDCHYCRKESALSDALARLNTAEKDECSICEEIWTSDDDRVATDCGHTFHYRCAQDRLERKNKTDCHYCHRESALGNALALKNATKKGECSICEEEWTWKDKVVTTNCQHTFHRRCAQQRLDKKNRTDCHFCHKENAIVNLSPRSTTTVEPISSQNQSDNNTKIKPNVSPSLGAARVGERKVNVWKCDSCSSGNDMSRNRCDSCGTPRSSSTAMSFSSKRECENVIKVNPCAAAAESNRNNESNILHSNDHESMDVDPPTSTKRPYESVTAALLQLQISPPETSCQSMQTDGKHAYSQPNVIVYISYSPFLTKDKLDLDRLIETHLQSAFQIKLVSIKCYPTIGAGLVYVNNQEVKNRLIQNIKTIGLDLPEKQVISFTDTLPIDSYIVVEKPDGNLPKPNEIRNHWIELYRGEQSLVCDIVSIQFPNIYHVTSTSLDDTLAAMDRPDFAMSDLLAHVYVGGNCSYVEDLPKSTTEDFIKQAIRNSIPNENISSASLHVHVNRQTNNACIITADNARSWATKNSTLYFGDRRLPVKASLTYRLLLHPILDVHNSNEILSAPIFDGTASILEQRGANLVLTVSSKKVFDECLKTGVLSLKDKPRLRMELYKAFTNPEDLEIDNDTWYQREMIRSEPDIMQFIADDKHPIFRYKWSSEIWLRQFENAKSQGPHHSENFRDQSNSPLHRMRHLLQMTVMLNTIGVIRKKSYTINDQQIALNLNPKLQTILYDHDSLLEYGQLVQVKKTPFSKTQVNVLNEDCLIVYEQCCQKYKKPLLLNMANAISPGGGYRKGDGAQEENLFRRSDYFRSLDTDLDHIQEQMPERFYCSHEGRILPLPNAKLMYPIDEYGAIYTSGLTFFRKSEDKGYEYMDKPLEGVCALAVAAYRNPKLDGNMLSPKFAVGMRKKIENLFSIAYNNKHDCLILSALGCGAFRNPAEHVAKIFRTVIEQYAGFFDTIVFAIINDHNSGQQHNAQGNFQIFRDELDGTVFESVLTLNQPNTAVGPYLVLSSDSSIGDVVILDLDPCYFGAKCNEMYDKAHAAKFSHPTFCKLHCLKSECTQTSDFVHMSSFVHRNPCKYGAQCKEIDNAPHSHEFEHPSYCPQGGECDDTSNDHEKAHRHLPSCSYHQNCIEYQKRTKGHCEQYRHYVPQCPYGIYCADFHDQEHIKDFKHPFPKPCRFAPYHCSLHETYVLEKDSSKLSDNINQHCLNFAHVCTFGRNCADRDPLHREKWIHVPRCLCPYGDQCAQLLQEDHLNSFTHPSIRDIRLLCRHADQCGDREHIKHVVKYRHIIKSEGSGVVRYFNLNEDTNFVQNQQDNITRLKAYIQKENWEPLRSESVPRKILDWIRTVQPVHRCRPEVFESILRHGHVMSRDYMEKLKDQTFVVISVLQHSKLRGIKAMKEKIYEKQTREFIEALVADEFEKHKLAHEATGDALVKPYKSSQEKFITKKQNILSGIFTEEENATIKETAIEIAQASIKLHSNPAGIGYERDKDLGTYKNVFSVLGPHLGHYYGDVFIVFKREILHHPDANFSIQSATSYASSNCLKWRPWLGNKPGADQQPIELFRKTKLHASVPGYEYATALELIATVSHDLKKKSMNIDLDTVLERWMGRDSHMNIEAHLPQLIPLDYIDQIYVSQNLFDSLSSNTRRFLDTAFKNRITKMHHKIELDVNGGIFGPNPESKARREYQDAVVKDILEKYGQRDIRSIARPIQGTVITIPSTDFTDHYLIPLTISQAFQQYKLDHPKASPDTSVYIYWQAMNGDMMLTLANQRMDNETSQRDLSCLICYVAEKPSTDDSHYHENFSYLHNAKPIQHATIIKDPKLEAKSRSFYVGCNTDDFMTFCLEIQRSKGLVTLCHAGPNSLYNRKQIFRTFSKDELDLNQLEFVHVGAGAHTVAIRNLIVTFEKQSDLHPTVDQSFDRCSPVAEPKKPVVTGVELPRDEASSKIPVNHIGEAGTSFIGRLKDLFCPVGDSVLTPCPDGIYCLIQYSDGSRAHNATYSHPCRFADQCRNQEAHLTHEARNVPVCEYNENCKGLCNPTHRAEYRHLGKPDFLIPCRHQGRCRDQSDQHRVKYFHGEEVLQLINPRNTTSKVK